MSVRPYHITWVWDAITSKEIASNECRSLTWCEPTWDFDVDSLLENTRSQITAACFNELQAVAAEKGYNVAVTSIQPYVEFQKRYVSRQFRDWTFVRAYGKLVCGAIVEFESDVQFNLSGPHFSPLIWWKWIFIAFLAFLWGLYVATLLEKFLESLFIRETTTTITYVAHCTEALSQKIGCEVCQDIEVTEEEKITEPDWMSLLIVGVVVIVGVAVVTPIVVGVVRGK